MHWAPDLRNRVADGLGCVAVLSWDGPTHAKLLMHRMMVPIVRGVAITMRESRGTEPAGAFQRLGTERVDVLGCAVESSRIIHLLVGYRHNFGDPVHAATALLTLQLNGATSVEVIRTDTLYGYSRPRCAVALGPEPQVIVVDAMGHAFAQNRSIGRREWLGGLDEPTLIQKVRTIQGRPYAVGLHREVYRRGDNWHWEQLAEGLPAMITEPLVLGAPLAAGFRDVDGFSDGDIYAVGGYGDVWRFDGTRWIDCGFPEPIALFAVCCGGDGRVYISGENGTLFHGRGNRWCRIHGGGARTIFSDMRWSGGKLWLLGEEGISQYRDDRIASVDVLGIDDGGGGSIDAADGVILIAAQGALAWCNGGAWQYVHIADLPYNPVRDRYLHSSTSDGWAETTEIKISMPDMVVKWS